MHNSGRGLSKAAKEGSEEMKKALKALSYSVPRIWWRRREFESIARESRIVITEESPSSYPSLDHLDEKMTFFRIVGEKLE